MTGMLLVAIFVVFFNSCANYGPFFRFNSLHGCPSRTIDYKWIWTTTKKKTKHQMIFPLSAFFLFFFILLYTIRFRNSIISCSHRTNVRIRLEFNLFSRQNHNWDFFAHGWYVAGNCWQIWWWYGIVAIHFYHRMPQFSLYRREQIHAPLEIPRRSASASIRYHRSDRCSVWLLWM